MPNSHSIPHARLRLLTIVVVLTGGAALAESPSQAPLSSFDAQAKVLLARMTLEEKIGQMTQPEMSQLAELSDITTYHVGSVLSGGNSDPPEGNSPQAWANAYDRCQKQALKTRLAIPLLYGIDAVHGHNNVAGAVIFPHHIGLGCTHDPALVERVAGITAQEVRATGINWTFAPCVTVPQDIRWGRTYEGFSEDPAVVASLGAAAVRGLQRDNLRDPLAVLACAKHFIGDGGTAFGTATAEKSLLDQGDMRADEATLRRVHLAPYEAAIAAGVATIMPSYSSWNGEKCSGNKYLLTDVLKGELGFEGFLISDYNAIDQLTENYKDAVAISINAGMDMVMVPSRYKEFYQNLHALVQEGRVPMSRIDDAVTRILRVKFAMGLFDQQRSHLADDRLRTSLGSEEHRAVAREAVRKSLVVLKNDDLLPISKSLKHIHVAGQSADDMARQCGGWTIGWQGLDDNSMPGTTILQAVQAAVSPDTNVTYSADGSAGAGSDLAILVVGEAPYAEGQGDSAELALAGTDIQAAKNILDRDIPTVLILVSGRPLLINDLISQSEAFVAAWLPGTEGQGVAEVLFGDYRPSGRLSFTWPGSTDQLPVGNDSRNGEPLFKLGAGLTYDN
jgi:beta-glucosidase